MKYFLIIIMPFISLVGQGSDDVVYESCTGFTTSSPQYSGQVASFEITRNGILDVVSDFGRRSFNSRWHRGVDITIKGPYIEDNGFHIRAINGGVIEGIYGVANDYKVISIGHLWKCVIAYSFVSIGRCKSP